MADSPFNVTPGELRDKMVSAIIPEASIDELEDLEEVAKSLSPHELETLRAVLLSDLVATAPTIFSYEYFNGLFTSSPWTKEEAEAADARIRARLDLARQYD